MIRNKKLLKVLTVMLLIVSVTFLTGCESNLSNKKDTTEEETYEQPVKNMVEGLAEKDSEKFLKAFPEFISNYMKPIFTDDYLAETVEKAEEEYGANLTMSYKVTDKKDITEEGLKEMQDEVKESFGKEITIEKGYTLTVDITTKGDNTEDTETDDLEVFKIDGNWYLLDI